MENKERELVTVTTGQEGRYRWAAVSAMLLAIGLCLATSKSVFPYGNLISEPMGALVCALVVGLPFTMKVGRIDLRPAVGTLLGTLASGLTFTTLAKVILALPLKVYLYGMLPVVVTMAIANTVVAQALFYPVTALLGGFAAKHREDER
ncbi:MAG: Tryptophan transporter TrpP [Firmicutes bacterium]|nr:Tryptophan transporter TrpP [Bacillota bacterium]